MSFHAEYLVVTPLAAPSNIPGVPVDVLFHATQLNLIRDKEASA
jgi:hypothetical protein